MTHLGIKKVRKLPVEVEAIQFTVDNGPALLAWLPPEAVVVAHRPLNESGLLNESPTILQIRTDEGVMEAREGDWIIKGVEGEFYPCIDSVFTATYEII